MARYLETRQKADGTLFYAFNPSTAVKKALDVKYKTFKVKSEATTYCKSVAAEFDLYRRKKDKMVKIDPESIYGLINFYKNTKEWSKLAENSQIFYNLQFRTACQMWETKSKMTFGQTYAKTVMLLRQTGSTLKYKRCIRIIERPAWSKFSVKYLTWGTGTAEYQPTRSLTWV